MKNTKILSIALLSSVLLSSCIKEAYHDSYLPADKKQGDRIEGPRQGILC